MSNRIGVGYDLHRLAEGRKLFLGGVEIPFPKGLLGHSDADVLLHAICDALLGAMGKGDIGDFFPDTDERYRDISSTVLLSQVAAILKKQKYKILNIDCVIVAEEPKLKDAKIRMRLKIAQLLHVKDEKVNVKATTQEGVGFGSAKEAIAAYAIALIGKEG